MTRFVPVVVALVCAGVPVSAFAVTQEAFDELRGQFQALAERFEELAAENAKLRAGAQATEEQVAELTEADSSAAWSSRIGIKGDVRYRYENIDEAGRDERNRQRVRARAAITADVADGLSAGIGIASGSSDPVSTNQTLGDGGSSKGLNLDLAYLSWSGIDGLTVTGGKFKNPLFKPGKSLLLWDGDWNPEGVGVTYANGLFFVNALGTYLESDSNDADTEFSWGGQAGIKTEFSGTKVTAGLGYFVFDTAGKRNFFDDEDEFFGNANTCVLGGGGQICTYDIDYEIVEVFAEAKTTLLDLPATAFVDFVQNQDANNFDTGFAIGAQLGKAGDTGTWQASYAYLDKEADAVLGLFTDSDFGGGGTDNKGHVLKGKYAFAKGATVGLSYFINERGSDAGNERDYDRLQLDAEFKYK